MSKLGIELDGAMNLLADKISEIKDKIEAIDYQKHYASGDSKERN